VHLENEQYVVFDPNRINDDPIPRNTHLTAFIKANEQYPVARTVLYPDFPTKFTWDYSRKIWYPRKGGTTFGRMVYIPPTAGEKIYARLILSVTTDLRSFEDMRTVDGTIHSTYREACFARGLLADDREWRHTLEEGKFMRTGNYL
jgi:hypothetical protein